MTPQEIETLVVSLVGNALPYIQELNRANVATVSFAGSVAKTLRSLGARFSGLGAKMSLALTLPISSAGVFMAKAAADFEKTAMQFEVMLGKDVGGKMLRDIQQFAKATPFESGEIITATRSLLGFGVAQKDVMGVTKMLGDISAGTGKDIGELAVIFGQIKGMGRLQGQDFLQLVNAGFPVQELAKTMGVSMKKLKKEMEDGNVPFEVVAATMRRLTSEGGLYANMMERLSTTAAGTWSSMTDEIKLLSIQLGNILLPYLKTLVEWIRQGVAWFAALNPETQKTILIIAGILAVMGPLFLVIGATVSGIGMLVSGMAAIGVVGVKIVAVLGLVTAAGLAVADGFFDANTGFLDFVNSIRIGGAQIGTWMQVLIAEVMKGWNNFVLFWVDLWDGIKTVAADVMEWLWRGTLATGREIYNAFNWVAEKIVGVGSWLTDKFTGFLGWLGILSDETVANVREVTATIDKGMADHRQSGNDFYNDLIKESTDRQGQRYADMVKRMQERAAAVETENSILSKAQDDIFRDDIQAKDAEDRAAEKNAKKAAKAQTAPFKMPVVPEFKIPKIDIKEVKLPEIEMPKMDVGARERGQSDFKSINLNRVSVAGLAGFQRKREEIAAPGVENRLDTLIGVTRQSRSAVLTA